jgi:hypothetical protein
MPIDINDLSEGWLELESDPGNLSLSPQEKKIVFFFLLFLMF